MFLVLYFRLRFFSLFSLLFFFFVFDVRVVRSSFDNKRQTLNKHTLKKMNDAYRAVFPCRLHFLTRSNQLFVSLLACVFCC